MSDDDDDDKSSRGLSYLGALGWTFALSGLTELVALVGAALRPGGGIDTGTIGLAIAAATLGVVLGMARVHAPDDPLSDLFGAKATAPILLVLSVICGVSLVFAVSEIDATIADKLPLDEETRAFFATDTLSQKVRLSALAIVVAVSQEVFFRGALFGLLERDKPRSMVVFVTTVLAVFPPSSHQLVSGFLLAAIAGHLRGLSRSLWPALGLRLGFAGVLVWATLTGHDDLKVPRLTQGLAALAAVVCLAVFVVVSRGITRSRLR